MASDTRMRLSTLMTPMRVKFEFATEMAPDPRKNELQTSYR